MGFTDIIIIIYRYIGKYLDVFPGVEGAWGFGCGVGRRVTPAGPNKRPLH